MKMQKTTPTSSMWMDNSFVYDDTDDDEDYENRFGTVDSVSTYTPGETDTETCGPYSVTSCPPSVGPYSVTSWPPSVGPDQDAFLPTPHMYAPTSPVCVSSPNFPDTGFNQPTDHVPLVLSAKKIDKMYDQVTPPQADPHQTNVGSGCIISIRENIQKDDFAILDNDFSYSEPERKALYEGYRQSIRRTATCSSFGELENLYNKQSVHTEPLDQRRMSLDEFIEIVPEEHLIRTLQDESQMSPLGKGHAQIVKGSNTFVNEAATRRNAKTPEQSKTTNRVRKRTANRLILSNSDFSSFDDEIPVKRQMVVPSQTHLLPHFKGGQMYSVGSIADEMCDRIGLAPVVSNSDSRKEKSISDGQNSVYGSPISFTASLRPDTGQFGQAIQDPKTSSLAAATPTITILDNNGNVVATGSQTTDSHINPGVVGTQSNHNHHKACTASNAKTSLQTQQLMTSLIKSLLPDTAIASVSYKDILEFLQNTAASTSSSPQQITHKPPDYHVSTVRSAGVKNDSKNHNFSITNENRLPQQETISNLNPSPTGPLYQNLQPSCIHPPDIGACDREATSSATTTTSFSFNDICQQQEMGRKSHLFNPSASTDPCPAGADLLSDAADPLLEKTDNSGISCLPVDAITAQMFTKSSTDSTSLYHTPTVSNTKSAPETTANTHNPIASDDVVQSLPGSSRFSSASASVYGYLGNEMHEDLQERSNTDWRTSLWEGSTPDELIQERSGVVEIKQAWDIHATATDRDDRINGIHSQTKYESHPAITSSDLTADTASALEGYQFICPSPGGHTYANGDTDYLIETNVEHISASRSSADDAHFSATNPQIRVFDVFLDAASQDSETMFACLAPRNVLTDAVSSMADSDSTAVDPCDVTDLVGALMKPAETAQISDVVKQSLKDAILTKRKKEGKAEIDLSFQPGGPHELTEEEQEKELRRKELNKKAARNHRQKKKTSKETQDKEYEDIVKKNSQLKEQVAQLESAKEHSLKLLQEKGILTLGWRGILNCYTSPLEYRGK